MNTKIVTYTGKEFDLLDPRPEMVCIEDIAHSLGLLCRYTGHVKEFYSVAQHCVLMAENNELPGNPLAKLLHDAAETYTGDIASPWKQCLIVGDFDVSVREWEHKIQKVIGIALGVDLSPSIEVKESDNRMYFTEVRDLMPPSKEFGKWRGNLKPLDYKISPWDSKYAKCEFLRIYLNLQGGSNE